MLLTSQAVPQSFHCKGTSTVKFVFPRDNSSDAEVCSGLGTCLCGDCQCDKGVRQGGVDCARRAGREGVYCVTDEGRGGLCNS